MAIIGCKMGKHYYDNEKYGRCPFCDGTINLDAVRKKRDHKPEGDMVQDVKEKDETLTVTKPN